MPVAKSAPSPRMKLVQRGASSSAAPSSPSSCPASSGSRPFAGRCGRPYAGRRGRPVAGRRDRPVAGRRVDEEDVQGVSAAGRCPSPLPRVGAAAARCALRRVMRPEWRDMHAYARVFGTPAEWGLMRRCGERALELAPAGQNLPRKTGNQHKFPAMRLPCAPCVCGPRVFATPNEWPKYEWPFLALGSRRSVL